MTGGLGPPFVVGELEGAAAAEVTGAAIGRGGRLLDDEAEEDDEKSTAGSAEAAVGAGTTAGDIVRSRATPPRTRSTSGTTSATTMGPRFGARGGEATFGEAIREGGTSGADGGA